MVRVSHTKKFLLKLTGYVQKFEEPEVFQFFRNTFLGYFRSNLTQYIIEHQVSFVDINAYSKEISGALLRELRPLLDEYGLELQHLQINTLSVPQDDPSFLKIKNSLAASKEQELLDSIHLECQKYNDYCDRIELEKIFGVNLFKKIYLYMNIGRKEISQHLKVEILIKLLQE